MAKKYGVASDYIKYTSRIKSDTSDGVAVEASQVVDLEQDKLQSDINKELKASIASASSYTYSKSEIDSKDAATLTSAKSYADQKVSALGSVYTTKGSCTAAQLKALTSAKAGDVWNITDAITIDGKVFPAGVNVVCVTAFSAAIDPAATKNWDALQGLQDLTSYAKWSQVEQAAISDVEFERDVAGEENSYTFKKTITYVGGTKREVDFGIILDQATYGNAGVMSAADKRKLDAVDERIKGVKVKKVGDGVTIEDLDTPSFGTAINIAGGVDIRKNAIINENVVIGRKCAIGNGVVISPNLNIGTVTIGSDYAIQIKIPGIDDEGIKILQHVNIGSDIPVSLGSGEDEPKVVGVAIGTDRGLGMEGEGNFVWWRNGYKRTAATADETYRLRADLSVLATRVSALEDLLKLA